ncbi:MAG TPA: hypothetical protein VFY23_00415, partial [Candidatus Limnocylindrales bacterium]|nr:hypothetical protein [Candidatus Limnocylindrales bacterium]
QGGVHALLQGERMWIEPAGFEQVHERGNQEAHRLKDPSKWVPYGVGAIEGSASEGAKVLPVLEAGAAVGSAAGVPGVPGAAGSFGPGEEPRPAEGAPTATANHELL